MAIESIPSATLSASSGAKTPARSASATEVAVNSPVPDKKPADQPPVSATQLQEAVSAANDFIKPINSTVEFAIDKDSKEMVVKIMDSATKEVLRQIPSEEMLAIAQALDKVQGLLIKQKA